MWVGVGVTIKPIKEDEELVGRFVLLIKVDEELVGRFVLLMKVDGVWDFVST